MKKVILKPPIIFIDLPRFSRDSDKNTAKFYSVITLKYPFTCL